ncbi:hypothetical protein OSTOST_02524 [Ostertagia ostertagi]
MSRTYLTAMIITDEEYYEDRINYLLSNSDEFLAFGRPISSKIVHIGGITLLEAAPLSMELRHILEQAKMGVVYISFGSNAPTKKMSKHFREAIVKAAEIFKYYEFIWESRRRRRDTKHSKFAHIQLGYSSSTYRNALFVEAKNTTIVITKEEFNSDTFAAALQNVLNDKRWEEREKCTLNPTN